MDRFVEELVEAGGPGDLPEKDGRHASVVGFCPCQRDKCFSFDAVHEPHLVILCDCSDCWIVPKPSAVIFFVAREDQQAFQRFHCTAEEKGAFPASKPPRSRGRSSISRTNSGTTSATMSRPTSSATTASTFSSTEQASPQAKEDSGSSRLKSFYCEACGDPVAYSFGMPEVFAGVAQGCYPKGKQLTEAGISVDYFADRRRLSRKCHAYFSQLSHSDVSEAIIEALQSAGVLTNSCELSDYTKPHSEQKEAILLDQVSNAPIGSGKKRVHPWPISGAPRLTTSSARIKGMASGGNLLSSSVYGIGADKPAYVSHHLMNSSDLTRESQPDNVQAITASPSKITKWGHPIGSDNRISVSAPAFKLSPYGAVLSRRPTTMEISSRRIPRQHADIKDRDEPAISLPQNEAQGSEGPRPLVGRTQSLAAGELLRSSVGGCKPIKEAAVLFDDGSAPRTELADRITEQTVQALRASKLKGSGLSSMGEHSNDSIGIIQEESCANSTYTRFSECMQKAKELLESGAKSAGKRIGANGQIVDEDELNQCKIAAPRRKLNAQALMSAHISAPSSDDAPHAVRTPSTSSQSSAVSGSVGPMASRIPSSFSASLGKGLTAMTAGKFAARFRQKVFKKSDFVIVSGSEPGSYNTVKDGIRLLRKADKIVKSIHVEREKERRSGQGFAHEEGEEKTFFQDSPWNPTFDVHYLNGGGALVDIGLDVSTDDMSSAA